MREQVTITRGLLVWLLVMAFLSPMAMAVTGVVYTNHVQQQTESHFASTQTQSDKRWCALFSAIDMPVNPAIKDPVQKARTEQVVAIIHRLRMDLHCL